MDLVSWMYISRSLLQPARTDAELKRIVEVARIRNEEHGMTGALLFTGVRFAQYIEGPSARMIEMQGLIGSDRRHTEVVTIEERVRTQRCFGDWSIVFVGSPAHFVVNAVERPLQVGPSGQRAGIEALQRLMIEFASQARD